MSRSISEKRMYLQKNPHAHNGHSCSIGIDLPDRCLLPVGCSAHIGKLSADIPRFQSAAEQMPGAFIFPVEVTRIGHAEQMHEL